MGELSNQVDRLASMRAQLYEIEDSPLEVKPALKHICAMFGASGMLINVLPPDIDGPLVADIVAIGFDASAAMDFERQIAVPDPWSEGYLKRYGGGASHICIGDQLFDRKDLDTHPWWPFLRDNDIGDVLLAVFTFNSPVDQTERRAVATMHRRLNDPAFDEPARQLFAALLPDIRRTLTITYAIKQMNDLKSGFVQALSALPDALALLDPWGRLTFANARAEAMFKAVQGAKAANGQFVLANPADNAALTNALNDVTDTQKVQTITLDRRDDAPILLELLPVGREGASPKSINSFNVLLRFIDPSGKLSIDPERIRAVYPLTVGESEVAALLCGGSSTNEIATQRDASVETVRKQIKLVFGKIGVSDRATLVGRLSQLV